MHATQEHDGEGRVQKPHIRVSLGIGDTQGLVPHVLVMVPHEYRLGCHTCLMMNVPRL